MRKVLLLALATACVPAAWGQSVLSAKSGTIHHVSGKAYISGVDLKPLKTGEFPALLETQVLTTEDANAEVLLSPGVFLRLGPDSEVKMVHSDLTDTELMLLKGSALVEAGEVPKGSRTTIVAGPYRASITKVGLYRFDASPERVRVFDGRLEVRLTSDAANARPLTMKRGREVSGGDLTAAKFNAKSSDELFAWSRNRSAVVAMANASAARAAGSSGSFTRSSAGSWVFLPTFGLYTYLPGRGLYSSPFGYSYYSPSQYWYTYYAPQARNDGAYQAQNGGAMGPIGRGDGGGGYSAPASASSPSFGGAASSSAPTRSGGDGGGSMPSGGVRR